MRVSEKVVNVILKLMEGWKTRLEVSEDGNVLTSRKINVTEGFIAKKNEEILNGKLHLLCSGSCKETAILR